jgi:hypothetical protein
MKLMKPDEPAPPQSSFFHAAVLLAFFVEAAAMLALKLDCDRLHKQVEMACDLIRQHRIETANSLAREIGNR